MRAKRNLFIAATVLLIGVLVVSAVVIAMRGPRDSVVELVSSASGELVVNDLYDGKMTIPKYDVATNAYDPDQFVERRGIVSYEGGTSLTGINVNEQKGEIDWAQVAEGGVDYAMIRVGYREYISGRLLPDSMFETNLQGALDAGLPVGVYFYSKAVTEAEAEEEASFVLEQIRGYSITWPIAIYWEYDLTDDGQRDVNSRTVKCNGSQVTAILSTFCKKVKAAGFTPSYYCSKDMGYGSLDLEALSGFDMWYAEFRAIPSFYYDFSMWQYTKEGSVPGIAKKVPISLSFKDYGK